LASSRLAQEAKLTGLFETSVAHRENILRKEAPTFWKEHRKVLKARVPGYGWWIWKSEYIRLALRNIPEGHGLMYCDAGNYISNQKEDIKLLISYLNLTSEKYIIGSSSQDFIEEQSSSRQLMDHLKLSLEDRLSNQFMAGFLLIMNNKEGIEFVNKWCDLTCESNHKYFFPETNNTNFKNVILPSYDQSIFSCLLKSYSKPSINIGDKSNPGCVRAVRHRLGSKYINPSIISISFFKCILFLSKIRLAFERRVFINSLKIRPENHEI